MGTHRCHPTVAALPVCMAGPGLHWHRRSREVCDDGRWLWPHPGAVLAVGSALPGPGRVVLGWREATTQLVPPGRAELASHTLQLLKASEQLLIVPDAANEIIAARRWEPLSGPCCWGQGCSARLLQAWAATGLGEHPGHPSTASTPFDLCPLPTLPLPTGDGSTARGHLGRVQGGDREGRGSIPWERPVWLSMGYLEARPPCMSGPHR